MNAPALPPFAALPPFVRPLANVIGVPATLRLAEAANVSPPTPGGLAQLRAFAPNLVKD